MAKASLPCPRPVRTFPEEYGCCGAFPPWPIHSTATANAGYGAPWAPDRIDSHSPAWHFRNAVARLSATVKIGGSARRPKRQWDKLDGKREWGYPFGSVAHASGGFVPFSHMYAGARSTGKVNRGFAKICGRSKCRARGKLGLDGNPGGTISTVRGIQGVGA